MTIHHENSAASNTSQHASQFGTRPDMSGAESETIFDRYADSIIAGNVALYDAFEIHGVRNFASGPDNGTHYEIDNINPTSFSVYVHIKDGGLECVGDFSHYAHAEQYGKELCEMYGWPVRNYVLEQHRKITHLQ